MPRLTVSMANYIHSLNVHLISCTKLSTFNFQPLDLIVPISAILKTHQLPVLFPTQVLLDQVQVTFHLLFDKLSRLSFSVSWSDTFFKSHFFYSCLNFLLYCQPLLTVNTAPGDRIPVMPLLTLFTVIDAFFRMHPRIRFSHSVTALCWEHTGTQSITSRQNPLQEIGWPMFFVLECILLHIYLLKHMLLEWIQFTKWPRKVNAILWYPFFANSAICIICKFFSSISRLASDVKLHPPPTPPAFYFKLNVLPCQVQRMPRGGIALVGPSSLNVCIKSPCEAPDLYRRCKAVLN